MANSMVLRRIDLGASSHFDMLDDHLLFTILAFQRPQFGTSCICTQEVPANPCGLEQSSNDDGAWEF